MFTFICIWFSSHPISHCLTSSGASRFLNVQYGIKLPSLVVDRAPDALLRQSHCHASHARGLLRALYDCTHFASRQLPRSLRCFRIPVAARAKSHRPPHLRTRQIIRHKQAIKIRRLNRRFRRLFQALLLRVARAQRFHRLWHPVAGHHAGLELTITKGT